MSQSGQPDPPTDLVVESLLATADTLLAMVLPPDPAQARPADSAFGHPDAAAAFASFFDRYQASWQTLTADHAALAAHLRDSAASYSHTDSDAATQLINAAHLPAQGPGHDTTSPEATPADGLS